MKGLSQFTQLSVRQFKGSLDIRYGVRQVSMGKRLIFALVVTSQNFLVIDLHSQDISAVIRRGAYPKLGKISSCERFFLASFSDNTVFLYNTRTGDPITKILGIPRGVNNFALAGNSSRIFYASNNIVCLWSVAKGQLELSSQQWRNINCFAIDDEAERIALGTYSGKIVILTMLSTTKVTQMELSRHRNCVMQVTFSGKNKIFSISYDKIFLTSTIETNSKGQKSIIYEELQLESVPRSIKAVCDCPYLIENQGMFWIVQGNKLRGFSQGHYGITEVEGVVYLIRYHAGKIEWFRK